MLLAVAAALLLRLWNLDQLPPGLYRDEAYNGLDALRVLEGNRSIIFTANNGREPLYIYLTAVAVFLFGQTTFAVRVAAAVIGGLTTIPVFLLGKSWFDTRVGLIAAWLWAITLWPIHLSRVGLRPILFVPLIALAFWLGTLAYRRQRAWLWFASGVLTGLTFYTYLVARFTPLLLLALAVYLLLTDRGRRLWPGILWFVLGIVIVVLPLLVTYWREPVLLLGRTGQVSILNPDVSGGSVISTLWRQMGAALGMYFWQGDDILRHNPPGRPVFDTVMAIPFLIGVGWCVRRWRRPPASTVLLWSTIMLGPTILAADAPHFLRAMGVLPGVLYLPALGLFWFGRRLPVPAAGQSALVAGLVGLSLLLTISDYTAYGSDPEVEFAFEKAAIDLAAQINREAPDSDVRLDERFWSSWPSISYLVTETRNLVRFDAVSASRLQTAVPGAIYAWPYDNLDAVARMLPPVALITVEDGSRARGDQEEIAYPLYVRYGVEDSTAVTAARRVAFGNQLFLRQTDVTVLNPTQIQVDIYWEAGGAVADNLIAFVHVTGADELIGQHDAPPGGGRWSANWWRPGLMLRDRHVLTLHETYDPALHELTIGLYDAETGQRLPVSGVESGEPLGDVWVVLPE